MSPPRDGIVAGLALLTQGLRFDSLSISGYDLVKHLISRVLWVACLLILADSGCTPKNQDMLVVYVRGNVADGVKQGTWDIGEVKECGDTNRAVLPDKRYDLLVCGAETQAAWELIWLRSDIKSQIYESARLFAVAFHSGGRSRQRGGGRRSAAGFYHPTQWDCKRTSERSITCE